MNSEEDARGYAVAAVDRFDNEQCVQAIHNAVYGNYQDNIFHSDIALSHLQETFSTERIALLLAVTALRADWDQRYSGEVRDWARKVILLHSDDEIRRAESVHFTVHPGLLNMLAEAVMQRQTERVIAEPEIAEAQPPAPEKPRNTMEHRIFKRMQELRGVQELSHYFPLKIVSGLRKHNFPWQNLDNCDMTRKALSKL